MPVSRNCNGWMLSVTSAFPKLKTHCLINPNKVSYHYFPTLKFSLHSSCGDFFLRDNLSKPN